MTPAKERESLTREVGAVMWQVSVLKERAWNVDKVCYDLLSQAWHKLDEAERLLRAAPERQGKR